MPAGFLKARHVDGMKNGFDRRLVGFLSSLISEWEQTSQTPATPARTVRLKRHAVIRLEKSSGVKGIAIKSGVVWLTGTPAGSDVLLDQGGRFETAEDWPYIIEALEPGEIVLWMQPDSNRRR